MTGFVMVVGALHLDVVVDAPRLPTLDETLMGQGVAYAFGGKGGNQAAAASRFGAKAMMAGRVGDDSFAARLLADLDAAGVDRSQVLAGPGPSGMSVAIVEARGDYGAVVVSGVNRDIRAEDVTLPDDLSVMLLQNEIGIEVNQQVAARLLPATRLILNAAPAGPIPADLLARTDLLVVNRVEAAALTGQPDDALDVTRALQALLKLGARQVIVTLGGAGLVCGGEDGTFSAPAFAVDPVSTHGAGDVFVGALAARLCDGTILQEACRFAQAAAALHVSTPVSERSRVTPADVRAFLAGR